MSQLVCFVKLVLLACYCVRQLYIAVLLEAFLLYFGCLNFQVSPKQNLRKAINSKSIWSMEMDMEMEQERVDLLFSVIGFLQLYLVGPNVDWIKDL